MSADAKAALAKLLDAELAALEQRMATYIARLQQGPSYVLERCAPMFEAAAQLEVLGEIRKGCAAEKATYATIRAYAMNRAKHYATTLPSSTSPLASLMDEYRRAAWCRLVFDDFYGLLLKEVP